MMRFKKILFSFYWALLLCIQANAEVSHDDLNSANNLLTPMYGLNFQDLMRSSLYGNDATSNSLEVQGTLPHMLGKLPQLTRMTVAYHTVPVTASGQNDNVSGLGDLYLYDIFLFGPEILQMGLGPFIVMPTATDASTGSDKWQAGLAATLVSTHPWGLLGASFSYQHDFAGDENRPTQNIAKLQPYFTYNLRSGMYARSAGTWIFNWENGSYFIPFGVGLGKVWKRKNGATINLILEPQWTAAHAGEGVPIFQTFGGLNFQFPLSNIIK